MASNEQLKSASSEQVETNLLERNLCADSTGGELLIKVSYSEEVGLVPPGILDQFLKGAQAIQELWDVRCTVGSRILETEAEARAHQSSEETDSQQLQTKSCPVALVGGNDLGVTRYYCKTAPTYNEIHSGATNILLPSVLIELFFTYDPGKSRDVIASKLRTALKNTVLCTYDEKNPPPQIKIISFLLAKD